MERLDGAFPMARDDLVKLKIDRVATQLQPYFGLARASKRRSVGLGVGLALLLLLSFLLAPLWRTAPVEVALVTTAYPAQGLTLLTATGYVVPQRKADVASKATGRLEWLGVDAGSRVKAGEIIAKLENRDLVAEQDRAVANIAVARGQLGQAEAEMRDAGLAKNRAAGLLSRRFVTQEVYDIAVARLQKAEAAVASAEANIVAAKAGAEMAKVAVDYTLIRAPFDGVVTVKNANIGDVVAPFSSAGQSKAAVVSMADLDTLQVEADVSEASLQKVQVGQPCEIQLDALPERRLLGTVQTIVPTVDKTKATVLAKVRFDEKDDRILPEMSAKVAFLSRMLQPDERNARVVVTPGAVFNTDGANWVMVVREDHAYRTKIELGERLGEWQAITSGPKAGEQIVTNHPEQLQDGAAISVEKR